MLQFYGIVFIAVILTLISGKMPILVSDIMAKVKPNIPDSD